MPKTEEKYIVALDIGTSKVCVLVGEVTDRGHIEIIGKGTSPMKGTRRGNIINLDQAIEAIKKHGAAYLMAVGGAAYLVSKAIKASRVVAFADLGMEAIYEFEVRDMPVTVAVDATGTSVHQTGPREWQRRIGKIPVTVA